jgi:DNA-binding transcriptional ArsR family regulator
MEVFDVLSDPVRCRIIELLGRREMASGEVVEAIGAEFGITQANSGASGSRSWTRWRRKSRVENASGVARHRRVAEGGVRSVASSPLRFKAPESLLFSGELP